MNTALLFALAAVAAADPSADGPTYIYDLTYESAELKISGTVNPAAPRGERVTNLQPARETLAEEVLAEVDQRDESPEDSMWCNNLHETVPDEREVIAETAETETWAFQPLPDAEDPDSAKFMKFIRGEMTIAKADNAVLAYHLTAPKPFKPAVVAKVTGFDLRLTCERSPDGRPFAAQSETRISGSAMMQKFDEWERQTISNLRSPGDGGGGMPGQ